MKKIAFIGAGNMARSLVSGLCQSQWASENIIASDPDHQKLQALQNEFGITTTENNAAAIDQADVLMLAVKPQIMAEVLTPLQQIVQTKQPLIISVAAGLRSDDLNRWLGGACRIVRCMPNTPALVQSGATGLFANAAVSAAERDLAESILRTAGMTVWVAEESQLDAVTAVSGSGPAYYFLVMEAMENAGVDLGLPRETARLLALETAFGAAKLALESRDDAATLRQNVTSKGGTTAAALAVFEQRELREIFRQAMQAAADRAQGLATELGADA